jgi:hypothetical protein
MSVVGSAITLILALVLATSAIGKLQNVNRFGATLSETFGFPSTAARRFKIVVPIYELITALLLVPAPTQLIGVGAAGAFFAAAFLVASAALLTGRTGDCACFGDLTDQRLGRGTIFRLCLLIGLDALAAFTFLGTMSGQPSMPSAVGILLAIVGIGVGASALLAAGRAARAMR